MKELPTSPPNGRPLKRSGTSEQFKIVLFNPSSLYLRLGQLLSKETVDSKGHEEGLGHIVETILDTIICLPELDIGHSEPCPFYHMALVLGVEETDTRVKHVITELQHTARDLILKLLSEHQLEYIFDIRIHNSCHMHLIGGRFNDAI